MISITPLSQRDPRWANLLIGNSPVSTVAQYGCLWTCWFMLCLRDRAAEATLARSFMACLRDNGNYESDVAGRGAYAAKFDFAPCVPAIWGGVRLLYRSAKFAMLMGKRWVKGLPTPDEEIERLVAHLRSGQPAIVEVDSILGTQGQNQHFVLATGLDADGQVLIADPWPWPVRGTEPLAPRYGASPGWAVWRYLLYEAG